MTTRVVLLHSRTANAVQIGVWASQVRALAASPVRPAVKPARDAWSHYQQTAASGPRDYDGWPRYLTGRLPDGSVRFTDAVIPGRTCGRATAGVVDALLAARRRVYALEDGDLHPVTACEAHDPNDWKDGWTLR